MKEDPDNKSNYFIQFVDIQMEAHGKTCPLLNRLKDKMSRKIEKADLDATARYDLHARLEGMPTHSKVCHGDFWPSNIIISQDGTPIQYVQKWLIVAVSQSVKGNEKEREFLLSRASVVEYH